MAGTVDIEFKLMKWENRSFQQALMERAVANEAALRELTEAVNRNSEDIAEVRQMLEAIIEHMKVPYKPPAGFTKE